MSTSVQVSESQTEKLLQGITLPPQPATLINIRKEQAKKEPDLDAIADTIARDLSVAAGVLKTVNSPFFGLRRKIDSIHQAVRLLGLGNVVNIVTSLSLRESMKAQDYPSMDRFFDSASDTALVAAALAKELSVMPADRAYTLGLFHDCGMPLLMQKFPSYKEVLREANATADQVLTEIEDRHLSTNHAVVGYYVSRSWGLPDDVSQTIINHHRVGEILAADKLGQLHDEMDLASKVALLAMAEHFSYAFRGRADQHDWDLFGEAVLAHFDLRQSEYEHLKEDIFDRLAD